MILRIESSLRGTTIHHYAYHGSNQCEADILIGMYASRKRLARLMFAVMVHLALWAIFASTS